MKRYCNPKFVLNQKTLDLNETNEKYQERTSYRGSLLMFQAIQTQMSENGIKFQLQKLHWFLDALALFVSLVEVGGSIPASLTTRHGARNMSYAMERDGIRGNSTMEMR